MCICALYFNMISQKEQQQQKEWVSPVILPFNYTLQMFVFILVVIPLVTWSRKNCPCIKCYITDLLPFTVLGLTSRCSYSTVVGKDLCGLLLLCFHSIILYGSYYAIKKDTFRADNKTSTSGTYEMNMLPRTHADTNLKFLFYYSKAPRYWSRTQGLGIILNCNGKHERFCKTLL